MAKRREARRPSKARSHPRVAPRPNEEKKAASRPRTQQPAPLSRETPAAQEEEEETRSSPLVRKIAREHGISLSQITGTGLGGRITKQDIMQFIENQGSAQPAPDPPSAPAQPAAAALRRRARQLPLPTRAISSP